MVLDEHITVLIPTSPIPSHPSTAIIEETIGSIRAHLPTAKIIIMSDGVRKEMTHRAEQYAHYRSKLYDLTLGWNNVNLILFDQHLHQAQMTKIVLRQIDTPLLLFVEHDTPLVTDFGIEWEAIEQTVMAGEANMIRLHHESHILDEHKVYTLDVKPQTFNGANFVRTIQWSQRPHVASVNFYRQLLHDVFSELARCMIEDGVHRAIAADLRNSNLVSCWNKYRIMIYAPDTSDNIKRSYTTDGRRSDPKFEMVF